MLYPKTIPSPRPVKHWRLKKSDPDRSEEHTIGQQGWIWEMVTELLCLVSCWIEGQNYLKRHTQKKNVWQTPARRGAQEKRHMWLSGLKSFPTTQMESLLCFSRINLKTVAWTLKSIRMNVFLQKYFTAWINRFLSKLQSSRKHHCWF